MRRVILLAALLAAPLSVAAQTYPQRAVTLAYQWDLDGEAADDDQIVTAATLADSTTFGLAAQPDVCRLIDMTIVDGDSSITAGTVTFTGTDCLGYARVCRFDFAVAATRGSGVKTLSVVTGPPGSSCYLAGVTSVVSSALTGEGGAGDTIKAGYTTNSAVGWALFGTLKAVGSNGEHGVDPFVSTAIALPITTSGTSSTTVTAVSNNGAFTNVVTGDLLAITVNGVPYERRVTARASENSITVHSAITIANAGVPFSYRHLYYSTDPTDAMAIPVRGYKTALFNWRVDANVDTGGVVTLLECASKGPGYPTSGWTQLSTTTVATGSTQSPTSESINLDLLPFYVCRMGFRFGTGDDADSAPESISYSVTLTPQPAKAFGPVGPNYYAVSVSDVAGSTTLPRYTQGITIAASDSSDTCFFHAFSDVETAVAATTSHAPIAAGEIIPITFEAPRSPVTEYPSGTRDAVAFGADGKRASYYKTLGYVCPSGSTAAWRVYAR